MSPAGTGAAAAPAISPASDQAADAFAVGFARTYLANPSAESLAPYLAEGARVGTGTAPKVETAEVQQAEVSGTEDLGGGEAVLTVACELRDSRTLYLAVPIARSGAGEVAALGAPSIVAAPGIAAGADADRPQPLAGGEAGGIESLVSKFLPTYLSSAEAGDLSYLLLPGTVIQPLGGAVALKSIGTLSQIGDGEGRRRTVLAAVRVTDPSGGGTYPLVYRLQVKRGGADGRWYVAALEGVSA
ncbi:MAG: conjugal transfer protein [Solirubrobacterales bacterium]|nr:conjugal transfer protein [Solirubrobacterales bacterium]